MNELIINGRIYAQRLTGVQRVGKEIVRYLSQREDVKVIVALPPDANVPEDERFSNVEYCVTGKNTGNKWEQFSLPKFCKKRKLPLLCTGNLAPFLYRSHVILHDVTFKEKNSYAPKRSWVIKTKLMVRSYIYRSKNIFTDSEFSANRIRHFYKRIKNITVLNLGYEHIQRLKSQSVSGLPDKFFLSVGSVNPNKNFQYILKLASNNPALTFVIAGKKRAFSNYVCNMNLKNVIFTDYVTDEQLKWLYENCYGFILPSLYEGFGMPPLEAAVAGCRRLYLSGITVFREIYAGCAKFFNPNDYQNTVDLNEDINIPEEKFNELFKKYNWRQTVETICNSIFGN